MLAEEGFDDDGLIGFVAPLHHRPERAALRLSVRGQGKRRESQRRRPIEIAGQQEAAGRKRGKRAFVGLAGLQIVGKAGGEIAGDHFIGGSGDIRRLRQRQPGARQLGADAGCGKGDGFLAEGAEILAEQRQVEQPFAGIIDDIDRQAAGREHTRPGTGALIIERDAQLGNCAGGIRPDPLLHQCADMILVLEARHGIIWLRLQTDCRHTTGLHRFEERQPAAMQKIMDQRGNEDRLAGTGKAGDTEPDGRIDETAGAVSKIIQRNQRIVGKGCQAWRQIGIPDGTACNIGRGRCLKKKRRESSVDDEIGETPCRSRSDVVDDSETGCRETFRHGGCHSLLADQRR